MPGHRGSKDDLRPSSQSVHIGTERSAGAETTRGCPKRARSFLPKLQTGNTPPDALPSTHTPLFISHLSRAKNQKTSHSPLPMPKSRPIRPFTITTNSQGKRNASPGRPPSPTFSETTNVSAVNLGEHGPAKIITRSDLKASMQSYENVS